MGVFCNVFERFLTRRIGMVYHLVGEFVDEFFEFFECVFSFFCCSVKFALFTIYNYFFFNE